MIPQTPVAVGQPVGVNMKGQKPLNMHIEGPLGRMDLESKPNMHITHNLRGKGGGGGHP